LDQIVSGALHTLLKLDPYEFHALLGKLEIQPKLDRIKTILKHRRDAKRLEHFPIIEDRIPS
jgi:hypothetical protein